jgi:hypothetical protein
MAHRFQHEGGADLCREGRGMGDPIILRAIERILAVAIGGLAIYCGYRLFLAAPDQRADGRAELTLAKDKRLILTRVGPGTFFALFGTAVVLASYYFPVTSGDDGYAGLGERRAEATPVEPPPAPAPAPDELRRAIALLNATEPAPGAGPEERTAHAARVREAKLALMAGGWRREWGDPLEFPIWLDQNPRPPRPEFERALAVFESRD